MSENMLNRVTPWPWTWHYVGDEIMPRTLVGPTVNGERVIVLHPEIVGEEYEDEPPRSIAGSRVHQGLLANAPDYALLLAAITSGEFDLVREWSGDKNETLTGLWVHSIASGQSVAVELDPFGAPLLTPDLRAALKAALGINP